jgi:hypothetical protein
MRETKDTKAEEIARGKLIYSLRALALIDFKKYHDALVIEIANQLDTPTLQRVVTHLQTLSEDNKR